MNPDEIIKHVDEVKYSYKKTSHLKFVEQSNEDRIKGSYLLEKL
jgi:hypothetical protein